MARYNEILVGRFNRSLTKIFGMKGEAPAPQLASDIQVSHLLSSGVENKYNEQWNIFCVGAAISEVGGVSSVRARLSNPATSGAIAVVEQIIVSSNVAGDSVQLTVGKLAGNLPGLPTSGRLDARTQVASGAIVPSTDTSGGLSLGALMRFPVISQTPFQIILTDDQEIPLLPGDIVELSPLLFAATNIFTFVYRWRERAIEDSEKAS